MNIAIYAGSFNPIHTGHLKLAEYLIDHQFADEVWFVVSPCNPLKDQAELIDEFLRLDMVVLATEGNDKFKASDVEFTMPVPSYTIDTLRRLAALFPIHYFSLLIGSDNALVFNQWKDYSDILAEFPVMVYPRRGYDFSDVAEKYSTMKLLNTPYYDISSSEIRKNILERKNIFEMKDTQQWLHPKVASYIQENKLYC